MKKREVEWSFHIWKDINGAHHATRPLKLPISDVIAVVLNSGLVHRQTHIDRLELQSVWGLSNKDESSIRLG